MAQAPRAEVNHPEVIGRFKVLESIGTGGMAEVFLGVPLTRLPDDPPFVALKRLLPAVAASQPEAHKMFLDEAAILSRLNHRNIVRLIDVCSGAGSTYLVMELLDGVDLAAVIKRFAAGGKALPHAFSASVVAEIAAALSYATKAQTIDGKSMELVHRDVSPQNIFIQTDGSVRLLDFGVARANDRMTNTRTGMIKGKLSYLSPEQASCEPIDHRSDIFALGIVLYELTIGRRPFRGKNEFKLLQQIIECNVVWPSEIYASYPPKLQRVIEQMLARDPNARYRDASEAARDLRDYLSDVSIASTFTPRAIMATHFADCIELTRTRIARYANVVVGAVEDDNLSLSMDSFGSAAPTQAIEPPAIEKEIGDLNTVVVVHRYVAASAWRRSVDGLEGDVTIRFETNEDCRPYVAGLLAGLALLNEDIATIRLERAPAALVTALMTGPAMPHVVVSSYQAACPTCMTDVIVNRGQGTCGRCNTPIGLPPSSPGGSEFSQRSDARSPAAIRWTPQFPSLEFASNGNALVMPPEFSAPPITNSTATAAPMQAPARLGQSAQALDQTMMAGSPISGTGAPAPQGKGPWGSPMRIMVLAALAGSVASLVFVGLLYLVFVR